MRPFARLAAPSLLSLIAACGGGGGSSPPPGGMPPLISSFSSSTAFTVLSGPESAWTTRLAGPRGSPRGLAFTGTRYASVGGQPRVPGFQ